MHIQKSVSHIGSKAALPTGSWLGICAWQQWLFIVLFLEVLGIDFMEVVLDACQGYSVPLSYISCLGIQLPKSNAFLFPSLMPQEASERAFLLNEGKVSDISLPFIAEVQATSSFHNFANNYITTSQKSERCDHLVTVLVGECQSTMLNKAFKAWRRQAHYLSFFLPPCLFSQFQAVKDCSSNCLCSPEKMKGTYSTSVNISKCFGFHVS